MSGSTENLLAHNHLKGSSESIKKSQENLSENKNNGIINAGFVGDDRARSPSHYKKTGSFQQRPASNAPVPNRRHSSPDGSKGRQIRSKSNLQSHHRLRSASEDDLRRKAFLNSMKADRKYQSVNHLSRDDEQHLKSYQEKPKGKETAPNFVNKDLNKEDKELIERTVNKNVTCVERKELNQEDIALALERAQLQQYKRRLSLALNDRAKLTEQLQFLTNNVSDNMSRSFDTESLSPRSENRSIVGASPRLSPRYTSSPRYPALMGIDEGNERSLPTLPKVKLNRERLVSEKQRDSDPTYAVRIVENEFGEKCDKDVEGIQRRSPKIGNVSIVSNYDESSKENLSSKADNMWEKHLRGESFETEEESPKKDKQEKDKNNNKKPLTVEEFLANDKMDSEEGKFDKNDKAIREVLVNSSRYSPELYEPLVHQKQRQIEPNPRLNETNNLPRDMNDKRFGKDQDYENLSTLRVVKSRERSSYEEMVAPKTRNSSDSNEKDRRFGYMGPPGTLSADFLSTAKDYSSESGRALDRAPSNISDKLRYYKGALANRNEEKSSRDLADELEHETDPIKRREIQQRAAAQAAILRREASELLFEAMNLERLCDPNGRVRHVYLPH